MDFAELERDGWQRVASLYDATWSALTRPFVPHLLRAAHVRRGERVLDVACGPGYVAEAARAAGATVIGVDFCPEMVRLARERCPGIEFDAGDAQALAFPDGRFDTVLMNFGLLHLPQPERAIAEARRVLVAGGRFGFTLWAGPELSPGARIVDEALRASADLDVDVPKGPDYFLLASAEACAAQLASSGFDSGRVRFETVTEKWRVPDPGFVFEAERHAGVRTGALLARQTAAALAAIKERTEALVRSFADGDGYAIPYAAHVVVGQVES